MRRHTLAFAILACAFAPMLAGCFGRTGLTADDLEADDPGGSDTGGDGPVIVESGPEPDTSVVDTKPPPKDGRIDIFDVLPFPIPEGGPIGDCINCVKDNCGDAVNNCVNDPKCLSGLACTLTKCLTGGGGGPGGGFDFACITGCFKGDLKTAGEAISAFTCVIGKCGTKCGGFLGGGGIPGGGGGGGGKTPGGSGKAEFAPWTPDQIQAVDPSCRIGFDIRAFAPWSGPIEKSACEQKLIDCER